MASTPQDADACTSGDSLQSALLQKSTPRDLESACPPHSSAPDASTQSLGLALYATSSLLFACTGVFVKLLGNAGVPTWEIIFFRSAIVTALSLPQILRAGDSPLGNRRWLLLVRGLAGFASISALFFAIQLIPLADAAVIASLSPLFVALASPLVLHERVARGTFACIAVCVVGVVLVIQPPILFAASRLPLLGVAVALLQPALAASAKARCCFQWVPSGQT